MTGAPYIRCYLGVPLTTPDSYNVGSLCIIGTEPRHFSDDEAEVLASFGRLVMSQIELRALARQDGLTGALSRRAFEEVLRAATRSATGPLSLLFFDIDHFKVVNDRWGHPAGDRVIRAVAEAIAGEMGTTGSAGSGARGSRSWRPGRAQRPRSGPSGSGRASPRSRCSISAPTPSP